ncbi:MAG: glucosamine-6-phosphate deaminase [Micrococcales bacterium]|nr:glucosamine-6-phosphate deaminase [Micrococcales bacterium]
MEVIICENTQQIAAKAAEAIAVLLKSKPRAVIGLATGSSPLSLYDQLAAMYQAGDISFAQAKAFMLDEYIGLPPDHPEGYRNVIEREIASRVDFAPGAVQGPDFQAPDLAKACVEYDAAIKAAGGIDLQILGIGSDGHIAFNEPGSSLSSRTRIKTLLPQTVADNARFFDGDEAAVPKHVMTQGLGTIMEARHLVLMAMGSGKAEAIRQIVEGPVSAMWPGSIMQFHPHATVLVDPAAGAKLALADYYRFADAHKPSWESL